MNEQDIAVLALLAGSSRGTYGQSLDRLEQKGLVQRDFSQGIPDHRITARGLRHIQNLKDRALPVGD